jgi:cytochrome d ubiquinol oxidase subunit II
MGLQIFWFIVVAIFWTGFFILEGFDLGVGALHAFVGRTELERRVAINSIGPFWDGNEVWLIVAGASMFAAFPGWYATMFSAMYLALMLVIVCLIIRGVSFEWRSKSSSPAWRRTWTVTLTTGSLLLPLLFGIAFGDLLHGLPINQAGEYTGGFVDLLTGYGIWVGVTLLAITLTHGAVFLCIKTTGAVADRAGRLAGPFSWIAVATVTGYAIWTRIETPGNVVIPTPLELLAVLTAVAAAWSIRDRHFGWAFSATTLTMASVVASLFVALYPNVMVSSTNSAYNLTVANTAAGDYALEVMTIVALIFTPLVIAYQGWNYYVFRARITGPPLETPPPQEAPPPETAQPAPRA